LLGICESWIFKTERRNKSWFEHQFFSFQTTPFALCSSMHIICSIRIVMADSTVTDQLVNKVCLSVPLSGGLEKGHRPRIEFF
jgi:hypothetical protein